MTRFLTVLVLLVGAGALAHNAGFSPFGVAESPSPAAPEGIRDLFELCEASVHEAIDEGRFRAARDSVRAFIEVIRARQVSGGIDEEVRKSGEALADRLTASIGASEARARRSRNSRRPHSRFQGIEDLIEKRKYTRARELIAMVLDADLTLAEEKYLTELRASCERGKRPPRGRTPRANADPARTPKNPTSDFDIALRKGDFSGARSIMDSFSGAAVVRRDMRRRCPPAPFPPQDHMSWRYIPKGKYKVGTPNGEYQRGDKEMDPLDYTVKRGFFISETEVTQALYERHALPKQAWKVFPGAQRPAHSVSFDDAGDFCEEMSKAHPGFKFMLPNEFEWEIACRATRPPAIGPVVGEPRHDQKFRGRTPELTLQQYAWFLKSSEGVDGPQPVGQKKPNLLGLRDMHGNVQEWCRRVPEYSAWYSNQLGMYPVRGGSFQSYYKRCRASARSLEHGDHGAGPSTGFRIIACSR